VKSVGRLARSVEMMTQRPTTGSLRNSGKTLLCENLRQDWENAPLNKLISASLFSQ